VEFSFIWVTLSKSYARKQKWVFFSEHSVYNINCSVDSLIIAARVHHPDQSRDGSDPWRLGARQATEGVRARAGTQDGVRREVRRVATSTGRVPTQQDRINACRRESERERTTTYYLQRWWRAVVAASVPSALPRFYVTIWKDLKEMASVFNRCFSIANFNLNLTLTRCSSEIINILSRKQTKCCRKLTRLNDITYANRNLFTSRSSCDVAGGRPNSPAFRHFPIH